MKVCLQMCADAWCVLERERERVSEATERLIVNVTTTE